MLKTSNIFVYNIEMFSWNAFTNWLQQNIVNMQQVNNTLS